MSDKMTGGCLCGATRYEYSGALGPCAYCHCADCRRTTGSAFNVSVRFERRLLSLNRQQGLSRFTKLADSGHSLTRVFCADCGSPLFTESPVHAEFVWVKAGSFDDPTLVQPTHQKWTRSRVTWAHIGAEVVES